MYSLYVSSGFCSKISRKLYSSFGRGLSFGGIIARLLLRIGKPRQSIRFARIGLRFEKKAIISSRSSSLMALAVKSGTACSESDWLDSSPCRSVWERENSERYPREAV